MSDSVSSLGMLDWTVIAAYALGMIAIGWYYSRRNATREDYLLGGRKMNPLVVGLSLFATLFSAFSFLAWPGEMIKYGPTMWSSIMAFPLIYLVVGFLLIPFIMKLRVTSAYEILEIRLGLSVRMVGVMFFLTMRLFWMALIIYATTNKILIPLAGLNVSATPYVSALIGLITVIYTSMGGLRAVVLTDVIQSLILFAGAIVSIVMISWDLGGPLAWWPTQWPAQWPEITIGYGPTARVTVLGAMLATFIWYVCTSGSDQLSIQRCLATRDAKAARHMMATSLVFNALVFVLLGMLGLALLAYFIANPHAIPEGRSLVGDADKLFAQFIMVGLPVGFRGLVVAGLLAAAMSSLSSGISAACSVVAVDFFDRFRRPKNSKAETGHVRFTAYLSVLIGTVVVILSLFVGMVEGNLIELAYKVANILVAPLFGLFFMAFFVRWATPFGTLMGAAFGLATAVAVCYWKELTGTPGISFLWAMPLSLIVQVSMASMASLLPLGRMRSSLNLLSRNP